MTNRINVDMANLVSNMTIEVSVKTRMVTRFRMRIGMLMLKFAVLVIGCGVAVREDAS